MIDHTKVSVLLLAGGLGTRLHPYTAVFPKPLMPLGDMPVMEILLRRLRASGLSRLTICTGHLAELMSAFFGDGSRFGVAIDYVREDKPLGTAGPIALCNNLSDPFVVMNGDLLTTLDFNALLDDHTSNHADLTIATYPRDVKIDFGVLEVAADGRLCGYREKPVHHFDVSMGVYVCSGRVRESLNEGERLDIPVLVSRVMKRGGVVRCYKSDCYWLDIGRADDYARAQEEFRNDRSRFLGEDDLL